MKLRHYTADMGGWRKSLWARDYAEACKFFCKELGKKRLPDGIRIWETEVSNEHRKLH